jgi:hypothetical protein
MAVMPAIGMAMLIGFWRAAMLPAICMPLRVMPLRPLMMVALVLAG